ncbi:MAG: bifunctional folylpolyglutamate synthase/dihydrofolate synthase [Vampirovibrionales bacterium]|nr:bifunctional folylpolyglutamate synthase/dihydrofolate synthase [Vampirovibrionales bacterium]
MRPPAPFSFSSPLASPFTDEAALALLDSLECSAMKLGLSRMRQALTAMGNPQNARPVIHIAGTNGKGSTTAMLTQILVASGRRVGTFISPHLWDVRERIALNGAPLSQRDFTGAIASLREDLMALKTPRDAWPTYFEFLTLMAFRCFSRPDLGVDAVVLETGLGGRLDATNVVERPAATAITGISLDHQALLGDSLEAIASEKAGILKPNAPLILGPCLDPRARATILAQAEAVGAPVTHTQRERLQILDGPDDLTRETSGEPRLYLRDSRTQASYALGLCAPYQRDNAVTALGVVDVLNEAGWAISPEAIAKGLAQTRWPARFEWFGAQRWIVDGSHNAEGFASLDDSLRRWLSDAPWVMLLSLRANRDPALLRALMQNRDVRAAICLQGEPARLYHPPSVLADALASAGAGAVLTAASLAEAMTMARDYQRRTPESWTLAAGSLYTAGAVRQALAPEESAP